MALTTTSFQTTFDQQSNPKVFGFKDTTDYVSQGINPADCKCFLEITAPGGVIYYTNNGPTANISPGISPYNVIPIQLLLGANGLVVPGTYTFKMTTVVLDTYSVVSSYSYTYDYVSPVVSINQSVDCLSPLFTSTDTTVYAVNGLLPTIDRTHKVYFPVGSGLSTAIGSAEVLTFGANQFANGTQSSQIISELTYDYGNVFIKDTVTGGLEIQVSCEWVCKITCCLNALNNRMESLRTSNYQAFLGVKDIFTQVMSKVTLVMELISCGQQNNANAVIGQIQQLANCNDDCCGQDTPSLVSGLGSGGYGNVVVESGSTQLNVTSTTVGDTTTYVVSLNSSFLNQINSFNNTAMADNDGITWTSVTAGGVKTFTPHLSLATTQPDLLAFRVWVVCNKSNHLVMVTGSYITGDKFSAPTPTYNTGSGPTDYANFTISGFNPSALANQYKVNSMLFLKQVTSETNVSLDIKTMSPNYIPYITVLFDTGGSSNNSFDVRIDIPGSPSATSWSDLQATLTEFYVDFILTY